MDQLLKFTTEQGEPLLVEVADSWGQPVTRGGRAGAAVVEAGRSLDEVVGQLGPVVKGIVSQLRTAADRPDEVEVELAVEIAADSNVIIARVGGEANFRIALKWAAHQGSVDD
jgi:Trypsin-co-occurring domain 1